MYNIMAWYKFLALRFMIWRYRERSERTFRVNGFKMYRDVDIDVKLWVCIFEECLMDMVFYFLYGFGMGVSFYTSFIEKLLKDRIVVCFEWLNILYGLDWLYEYLML